LEVAGEEDRDRRHAGLQGLGRNLDIRGIDWRFCKADKKFAEIYMNEKRDLLPLLCHGDTGLYTRAWKIIHDYFNIADPNAKLETI
jgi:hypothetical protein